VQASRASQKNQLKTVFMRGEGPKVNGRLAITEGDSETGESGGSGALGPVASVRQERFSGSFNFPLALIPINVHPTGTLRKHVKDAGAFCLLLVSIQDKGQIKS
jgi:hypothetical protein